MQPTLTTPGGPAVQVPVMVAAELQDSLLVVMHDLHRLEGLLNHATDNLLERFGEANSMLTDAAVADSPELLAARAALRSAVTELPYFLEIPRISTIGSRTAPWVTRVASFGMAYCCIMTPFFRDGTVWPRPTEAS